MTGYLNKICPELLKVAKLGGEEDKNDCVVYARKYFQAVSEAKRLGLETKEYPFICAFAARLTAWQILHFARTNVVNFISKQTKVSALINVSKKVMSLDSLYAQNCFGKGVKIAIIDTGVSPHIDFCLPSMRIVKFVDLINGRKMPYDDNGHGTFVASIACGNGLASGGKFCGVAPQAEIVAIKALGENGEAGADKILEAMQWVSDNCRKYNIRVVCMSFGSNSIGRNDPLVVGAEALWRQGIVVVAAAGNSGPDVETIKSPGFSSQIITVGGVDDNRADDGSFDKTQFKIANFSSRGPAGRFFKPDLIAPAVNITGAKFGEEDMYGKMSGTSVATPMIAGVCLLVCAKYPNISPDHIKVRLLGNCDKISGNQNEEGFGLLNMSKFFEMR